MAGEGPSQQTVAAAATAAAPAEPKTGASAQNALPSINLPKGGGALQGSGEKFTANPATGAGSMSIPIGATTGRGGFGPSLSLTYDSGNGNGPFGMGWQLSVPSITRKTSKGIPRYCDLEESDTFVLAGAEDLVPALNADGSRFEDATSLPGRIIHRYHPRIESSFSKIERCSNSSDNKDVYWRVMSSDNVLSIYGNSDESRVSNPEDKSQIFTWLLAETRDFKGNGIVYNYVKENDVGVDLSQQHQRNRGDIHDPRRFAQRYLSSVQYGNLNPLLDALGNRPHELTKEQITSNKWFFQIRLDYGDTNSTAPSDDKSWIYRKDAFSTYRPGFEIRTTRICRRFMMFHHFEDESDVGTDCLVATTEFTYDTHDSAYTFLTKVTCAGFKKKSQVPSGYIRMEKPPVEFEYSLPAFQDNVEKLDSASLENLPGGLNNHMQWIDLYGDGLPSVLLESPGAWYLKRNLSPISAAMNAMLDSPMTDTLLGPLECLEKRPNIDPLGTAELFNLRSDGKLLDYVDIDLPLGFHASDGKEGWQAFLPIESTMNRSLRSPAVRYLDINGDGIADAIIADDSITVWHPSLESGGFGSPLPIPIHNEDELGPRQLFMSTDELIYLSDMSGDGLQDVVRIHNGEICYWPNLGYGVFGSKITMDSSPIFDFDENFHPKGVILGDIDGTGTTDVIYLHNDGVRLYFNSCGNGWSEPQILSAFPSPAAEMEFSAIDLLGNGTLCLVMSSLLESTATLVQYINLVGPIKPFLLKGMRNNMGAATFITYASSTKFYLQDKVNSRPWISKLPFVVHVVESVVSYDYIGKMAFASKYAYHHGCFDIAEREFRGFGMVEQWDTENISSVTTESLTDWKNQDPQHQLPPVQTKSWFHTGIFVDGESVTSQYQHEYYQTGLNPSDPNRQALLPDSIVPPGLSYTDICEAVRSLKGSLLRQEIYSDDVTPSSSDSAKAKAKVPHAISEINFNILQLQAKGINKYGVYHPLHSETVTCHLERNVRDPRISHSMTLEVDRFGNALKTLGFTYGRLSRDPDLPTDWDRDMQSRTIITYAETQMTNDINDLVKYPYSYQLPIQWESKSFDLTGFEINAAAGLSRKGYWTNDKFAELAAATEIAFEDEPDLSRTQKRLLGVTRTLLRKDDMSGLLPYGQLEGLALNGETYSLALTDAILAKYMKRNNQPLLPDFDAVLTSVDSGGGGYVSSNKLKSDGLFPAADPDGQYWVPTGQSFFSEKDDATQELEAARRNFFIAKRYRNPFGAQSLVVYDNYNLVPVDAYDFIGNRVSIGERNAAGSIVRKGMDYKMLHPRIMTDINGNLNEVAFDALGQVVGNAVRGKSGEHIGDSFDSFDEDMDPSVLLAHLADPFANSIEILGTATSRYIYDAFAYMRTQNTDSPQPCVSCEMTRVTHESDLKDGQKSEIIRGFGYSDGFGRTIQLKTMTNAGPVPQRDAHGNILLDENKQPIPTDHDVSPRWVASGWIIYNNKGSPVRQFEPFFSDRHAFEFDTKIGVSSVIFYDAIGRVVATLIPDGVYTKMTYDPWKTVAWDGNDTVKEDPRVDPDIETYVAPYFASHEGSTFKTWYSMRQDGSLGVDEKDAAEKAAAHANTPSTTYLDSQGRTFLTLDQNKVVCVGHPLDGTSMNIYSRSEMDCSGQPLVLRDFLITTANPRGRIVSKFAYDMSGRALYTNSIETGETWTLGNINNSDTHVWRTDGQLIRSEFDVVNRNIRTTLRLPGSTNEVQLTRIIYGDNHWEASSRNLCGEVYATIDQSGIATTENIDFQGRGLLKTHRICAEYRETIDWTSIEAVIPKKPKDAIDKSHFSSVIETFLMPETYTSNMTYDAIGRMLTATTPHSTTMQANTFQFKYDLTMLTGLDVNLQAEKTVTSNEMVWTPFLKEIKTNAKGQKLLIKYGNDVVSTNEYDIVNQLRARYTRRNTTILNNDLQSLHFTYDPIKNITTIRDDAQQTNYFAGEVTTATNTYVYDSTYRLIQATGREHVGQVGNSPSPYEADDASRSGPHPGQANAMAGYTEQYVYDIALNMKKLQHIGKNGGWSRKFFYEEPSSIRGETDVSNKLSYSTLGNRMERYSYDQLGSMTRLPHLAGTEGVQNMHWDFVGQLRRVDLGGGGTAYYTYNAAGQRVRKVIEKTENLVEDRLYLGEVELFRKKRSDQVILERETLHIYDDKSRVALIETRTKGAGDTDAAPRQLIRFQHTNHLSSSVLELDDKARILTFEEYSPYGSSTYQATTANLETPKRYRFTGKERDEETGLGYHESRYLAPWLARWISTDPGGGGSGPNLYCYTSCNPIRLKDPSGRAGTDGDIKFVYDDKKGHQPTWSESKDPTHAVTIQEKNAPGASTSKGKPGSPGSIPVPQEVLFQRAENPLNKVFMMGRENNYLGESTELLNPGAKGTEPFPFDPVSLKARPDLLFSRSFGELTELAAIMQEAMKIVGGRGNMNPTQYNNAINDSIRSIIKGGQSEAAAIVREAFALNKVTIAPNVAPKIPPGPTRPGGSGNKPSYPGYKGPPGKATRAPKPAASAAPTTTAAAPAEAAPAAAPAPVPAAPAAEPAVAPTEIVAPSPEVTPTAPKGGGGIGVGKAVGYGVGGVMTAGAVGNAIGQFEDGDTKGGVTTLAVTGGVTAVATKVPFVGQLAIPVTMIYTAYTHPEVLDHANDVYYKAQFEGHGEFYSRMAWNAVSLYDVGKLVVVDSTVHGLKRGGLWLWNQVREKEAY